MPVARGMVPFPAHAEWSISGLRERCAEVRDAGTGRIGLSVSADDGPARALYEALGYRHAHGPMISSVNLDGDDGPIPVGAVLTYLVKDL